jgi:hypothetical protein
MRTTLRIITAVLYVLLIAQAGLWALFGAPPLAWHNWYLVILPLAALVFWPGKRGE